MECTCCFKHWNRGISFAGMDFKVQAKSIRNAKTGRSNHVPDTDDDFNAHKWNYSTKDIGMDGTICILF